MDSRYRPWRGAVMGTEDHAKFALLSVFSGGGVKAEWDREWQRFLTIPNPEIVRVDRPRREKPNGNMERVWTRNQQALWTAAIMLRSQLPGFEHERELSRRRARYVTGLYALEGVGQSEDSGYSNFHGAALCGIYGGCHLLGFAAEAAEALRVLRYHIDWSALHSYRSAAEGAALRVQIPGRRMGSSTTTGFAADLALWLGLEGGAGELFEFQDGKALFLWGLRWLDRLGLSPFTEAEKEKLRRASLGDRLPVAEMMIGAADDAFYTVTWDVRGGFDSGLAHIEKNSENPVAAVEVAGGFADTLRPSDISKADGWVTEEAHPETDGKKWWVDWEGYAFRGKPDGRGELLVTYPKTPFRRRDTLHVRRGPAVGKLTISSHGVAINGEFHPAQRPPWPVVAVSEQEGGDVPNEPKPPSGDNPPQQPTDPWERAAAIHANQGKAIAAKDLVQCQTASRRLANVLAELEATP